jgi:hypothetical protein
MHDCVKHIRHIPGEALQEARLAAWSIMIGRHNGHAEHRRPHRGMLPDVCFDLPPPPRRSLFGGIAAWLSGFGRAPAAAEADIAMSAATAKEIGKSPKLAYIGDAEAGRTARRAGAEITSRAA